MKDAKYLSTVLPEINRVVQQYRPEFILYDAGVDVTADDELGRLNLSRGGLMERDTWVFELGVRFGCPIVSVIGGGYQRDYEELARRHLVVVQAANSVWKRHRVGLRAWS